jgi:fatty-acyl-CoA synthase
VVVRAPWLTQGYLGNPLASQALWHGSYLHTNDIGTLDGEGYLRITDRLKDVIKTGGEWVSSLELEDLVSQHAAVSEVAVIAVNDRKWGERPVALVVCKPDFKGRVECEEIRAYIKSQAESGRISRYGIPERVVFVEALERTSVGKLNKKAMREKYAALGD